MPRERPPRGIGADRAEAAPDGTLRLECAIGKGWQARVAGSQTRSEHPGTAVEWRGQVYEVLSVEPLAGTAVQYRLALWGSGHAIRRIEHYDAVTEDARRAERVSLRVDSSKRWLAILFSPVLGHLPGAAQKAMERDFGAPAIAMTIVSAFLMLVPGVVGLLSWLVGGLGGQSFVPEPLDNPVVAAYLSLESGLRLASAFVQGEPMGSLAGYLLYAAFSPLRWRASSPREMAPGEARPADSVLQDRYTLVEPLLSLLAPEDQQALELKFGFDPLRWGRLSAMAILLAAGANVLISVVAFLSHTDSFFDFAALVIGGFFVVEQIARRRRLALGKPAGSILGALVRPLVRTLLKAARA